MGITGLIPFMHEASREVNIRQFKGCCVAIDAYCWLHKGAYICAEKLARGEQCYEYVHYCMKYVNMLLSYDIKPILVFDGRYLPAKAGTEKKRRESREASRKQAAEFLRAGRTAEASRFLRRCLDVTHAMALNLMQECRRRNVDCIVAPYEADAQLAYLNIMNIAQIVITEDSDLVLFGCTKIFFKMDLCGNGKLVETDRLHLAMGVRPENYAFDKFRYMCILSGCDYLPSLPGVGLAKACKFITRSTNPDIHKSLTRLPMFLNMHQLCVTPEYRDQFLRADATFRYQLVYDPVARKQTTLTPTPPGYKPRDYTGRPLDEDQALQLALGNLDPFTLAQVDTFDPEHPPTSGGKTAAWTQTPRAPHPSIWSKSYKIPPVVPFDPCEVARPSTRGHEVTVSHPLAGKRHALLDATEPPVKRQKIEERSLDTQELVSLYTTAPSDRQRAHQDDHSDSDGFVETTPIKRKPEVAASSPIISGHILSLGTPFRKDISFPSPPPAKETLDPEDISALLETSPMKEEMKSPVIGRSSRNPFKKKAAAALSPTKTLFHEKPAAKAENQNSALAKFGRLRYKSGDEPLVQSRFFKGTKSESQSTAATSAEKLKDISNSVTVKSDEASLSNPSGLDVLASPSKKSACKIMDDVTEKEVETEIASPVKTSVDKSQSPRELRTKALDFDKESYGNRNGGWKSTKTSTFQWGSLQDQFGFAKQDDKKQIKNTAASAKSYKIPFAKKISVQLQEEEQIDDSGILGDSLESVASSKKSLLQSSCDVSRKSKSLEQRLLNNISFEQVSLLDEEDVDDPSSLGEPCADEDCQVTFDEGFCSQTPPTQRSAGKTCRQFGLSKSKLNNNKKSSVKGNLKQPSILSMFAFQAKSSNKLKK